MRLSDARAMLQAASRSDAGMTRAERVAHGRGSAEDLAWSEEQNRLHKEWLASSAGQAWLRSQPWWRPAAAPVAALLAALSLLSASASQLSPDSVARLADAVRVAEGGPRAASPYGVLSVKVSGEAHARRVCEASVRANWRRWEAAGRPGGFVRFMAARWCPEAADPQGHENWVRNVGKLWKEPKISSGASRAKSTTCKRGRK